MKTEKVKQVEHATLKTFQEEIPSIYFSDKTEKEFKQYSDNALFTYRDLFKFPPKMFAGASLIDSQRLALQVHQDSFPGHDLLLVLADLPLLGDADIAPLLVAWHRRAPGIHAQMPVVDDVRGPRTPVRTLSRTSCWRTCSK